MEEEDDDIGFEVLDFTSIIREVEGHSLEIESWRMRILVLQFARPDVEFKFVFSQSGADIVINADTIVHDLVRDQQDPFQGDYQQMP